MTPIALAQIMAAQRPMSHPVAYRGDAVLSWRDFLACVAASAAALARRPEPSWALVCRDAYYFLCGLLAALHAGKRVVIPPNFQPGTLESLRAEATGWLIDEAAMAPASNGLLIPQMSDSQAALAVPIARDATIDLFTSGTSGAPKRVRKQFAQLADEVEALEVCWGTELNSLAVVGMVPHHHIYGLLFRLLWPLHAGRPFDVTPCGNPNELIERLRKHGRAAVISSPAQLSRLPALTDPAVLKPYVARIFSSGGPLTDKTAYAFIEALGQAPTEVYGSSETGGIAWRVQAKTPDAEVWTPLPMVNVRVDEAGALQVCSPFVESGAWLTTADGAEFLGDGRFRLRGRLDRVVKLEEKRVSLVEMEQHLCRHPWVAEAGVLVLESSRRVIGAVLVLNDTGRACLADEGKRKLTDALRQDLARYYESPLLPRHWRFVDALPRSDRDKVTSQTLATLFRMSEERAVYQPQIINEVHEATSARLKLCVVPELAYFPVHFAELPVLPGVVQIHWAIDFARRYFDELGAFRALDNLKFNRIIPPGTVVELGLRYDPYKHQVEFSYQNDSGKYSSGKVSFAP